MQQQPSPGGEESSSLSTGITLEKNEVLDL
jgi:hypothetical protein